MTVANSNTTSVLPDQRMPIIDRYRRWSPVWWRFMKPLLESVNRNSETLTAVSEDLTTAQASITAESIVRANADEAFASQIATLTTNYQLADTAIAASVTNEATARAAADGALASQISTVSTSVGANSFSIQQLTTSVDGFAGRWSVSLNANNRVVGMVTLNGNSTSSEFAILANRFVVVHPTNNGDTITAFETGVRNGVPTIGISGNVVIDNTIAARHIIAGSITSEKIFAGAITADKVSANAIAADKISAGAITADKIAASAVTADKITASAVTAEKIAVGAVTAEKIVAGAVSAEKLSVTTLASVSGNMGTLTVGKIQSASGRFLIDATNETIRITT